MFAKEHTFLKSSSKVNDFIFSFGLLGSQIIAVSSFLELFLSKIFSVIFNYPSLNHSTFGSSKFQDKTSVGFLIQ